MPSRHAIVSTIGEEYVIENIEAGEFSHPKNHTTKKTYL